MSKKIKDLTDKEIDALCNTRRTNNKTDKPYNACVDCPLRWGKHCIPCVCFMSNSLYTRMINTIGDKEVEV